MRMRSLSRRVSATAPERGHVTADCAGPYPVCEVAMIAHLRSELGADALAEAWSDGRVMTLDESLDYALENGAERRVRAKPTRAYLAGGSTTSIRFP